jgi:ethanolamine utilization protein EutS
MGSIDLKMHASQRIIQELVPGRQITLAHIIANPAPALYESLKIKKSTKLSAIGIFTVTPPETAIIIADIAIKSSGSQIVSADRVSGSLIITGSVSEVEASVDAILHYVGSTLGFEICKRTKT